MSQLKLKHILILSLELSNSENLSKDFTSRFVFL